MPVSEKRREYQREYARIHRADRTARQNTLGLRNYGNVPNQIGAHIQTKLEEE